MTKKLFKIGVMNPEFNTNQQTFQGKKGKKDDMNGKNLTKKYESNNISTYSSPEVRHKSSNPKPSKCRGGKTN